MYMLIHNIEFFQVSYKMTIYNNDKYLLKRNLFDFLFYFKTAIVQTG